MYFNTLLLQITSTHNFCREMFADINVYFTVRLITDCRQRSLHRVTKCTMPAFRCPFFLSPLSSERYLQIEVAYVQDNMSSGVKSFIHKRCQLLLLKVKYRVHSAPFIQALFPHANGMQEQHSLKRSHVHMSSFLIQICL